ncbi:MAG: hypothetical protein AAGC60_18650 [Acidobacteriota bacterium]
MGKEHMTLSFDFATSNLDWSGDFADYPVNEEEFFELGWGWDRLPNELGGHGIRLTGNNHSDDLFMFARRPISGLSPSTCYQVSFHLTLATNAPSGCVGVGGAPGEAVFVKVGASTVRPVPLIENGTYRMNIDKGNQAQGGRNAVVVGDLANGETDCENWIYRLKNYEQGGQKLEATTDKDGSLWLFVGTDSGFEATSTPYIARVEVSLSPSS